MAERNEPIISFRDFSFQYRAQKRPTLTGIDLDIYPGERVLIAGPSGSGKSTLAGCINALFEPRRVYRHPDRGRRGCAAQQHL
jgi:ABC-type bacteriocin/lantibiotic exporter with double-glycine peptidase domain